MNTIKSLGSAIGLFLILLTMVGCNLTPTPVLSNPTSTDGWKNYTSPKHKFSIQYPPGWQYKEFLSVDHSMNHDEVWFMAGELPPANTDARPDVLLIITVENPSAQWLPEYFDGYQSETIRLGEGWATKISGINKESFYEETVIIMKLNEVYLQAFPGEGQEATEFFEMMLASLEPSPEAISISTFHTEGVPCISPYFDPVAFFPDNDKILIRAESGIIVFNLKTHKEEILFEPPIKVTKAALSRDGQILALALEDHSIELIELSSTTILKKLEGHTGVVTSLKFSVTGDRLYTASHDNYVRVWITVDGSMVSEVLPGGGEVLGIGVSPDDTKLAIVTFEGSQKLWNLETNELLGEVGSSGGFDGADASFSPDGKIFGISSANGPVSLWDAETKAQLWIGGDYALALSPEGRFFAYSDTGDDGSRVIVIRSLDKLELQSTLQGQASLIWKIILSPDGSRLASADGNEIRIWQIDNGELLYTLSTTCP